MDVGHKLNNIKSLVSLILLFRILFILGFRFLSKMSCKITVTNYKARQSKEELHNELDAASKKRIKTAIYNRVIHWFHGIQLAEADDFENKLVGLLSCYATPSLQRYIFRQP
jgi:hypothetical protein